MLAATRSLPTTLFRTSHVAVEDRFEAWRESISVIFDVTPSARVALNEFEASVHATHLGQLMVGDARFGAQQFARGKARAARDGLNHYMVQWYREGGFAGQHDSDGDMQVRAGDIVFFDMTRPLRTVANPSRVMSLVLTRTLCEEAFGASAETLHGTVLRSGDVLHGLLADHLDSLHRRLPAIDVEQAGAVAHATTRMLAACFSPAGRARAHAQAEMRAVTRESIEQYIGRNLGASLTPESLCGTFGVSRTLLYKLFEPLGGVAHYVQHRRLLRAFHSLTNPANQRLRVAEIGTRLGFASEAHFSRAFRAAFGLTPRDARASGGTARALQTTGASSIEYADWVRGL
ncbi:helix-turn-helix domain-containing protein [Ottowia thiooxydans]|uniref:helix-turn-helix domain-containing protein n=1 Tax=Ottowia thiooxydans TaxID=219182 RepID=UPI0004906281|nr:helix-turn-helix domain-containing protein [Ottowia thiooxydans]